MLSSRTVPLAVGAQKCGARCMRGLAGVLPGCDALHPGSPQAPSLSSGGDREGRRPTTRRASDRGNGGVDLQSTTASADRSRHAHGSARWFPTRIGNSPLPPPTPRVRRRGTHRGDFLRKGPGGNEPQKMVVAGALPAAHRNSSRIFSTSPLMSAGTPEKETRPDFRAWTRSAVFGTSLAFCWHHHASHISAGTCPRARPRHRNETEPRSRDAPTRYQ